MDMASISNTLDEFCVSKADDKQQTTKHSKLLRRGNKNKRQNNRGVVLFSVSCVVGSPIHFILQIPAGTGDLTPLELGPWLFSRGSISRPERGARGTNAAKTWGRGCCCGASLQGTLGHRIIKQSSSWIMMSISGCFGGIDKARCDATSQTSLRTCLIQLPSGLASDKFDKHVSPPRMLKSGHETARDGPRS